LAPATKGRWAAFTAPTLVVASGKDDSEYMNTAQHWPTLENPETFNVAALRFLAG
jgi:2-hydroxy-6-oxonona-2,4-dienedioate hydrolase